MWVRGLKPYINGNGNITDEVAPYVGAWIETDREFDIVNSDEEVAPYVGAWIETRLTTITTTSKSSRTLCGCVD